MFETISKIAGFEIKPNKDFYILANGEKMKHHIREDLTLMHGHSKNIYLRSEYSILPIFNGGYKLEEIKEPLLTDEEKKFLRHFNFEKLEISINLYLYNNEDSTIINSNTINYGFDGLERDKIYTREELGLWAHLKLLNTKYQTI